MDDRHKKLPEMQSSPVKVVFIIEMRPPGFMHQSSFVHHLKFIGCVHGRLATSLRQPLQLANRGYMIMEAV